MNKKITPIIFSVAGWILLLGLVILRLFIYQQVTVIGASMEPNYHTGELLMVNQINKNFQRGQVVAVYDDKVAAKNADYWTRFHTRFLLKRIICLPNEQCEIIGSKVIIYNQQYPEGRELVEDYISDQNKARMEQTKYYFPKTTVASDNYFVMGDNRTNSSDSREKGTFPTYALFGQESVKFWPLNQVHVFKLPEYKYKNLSEEIKAEIVKARESSQNQTFLYE